MSATASDWETFGLWVPATAFTAVDTKDFPGLWAADVLLVESAASEQPDGVVAPPDGWHPTHALSVVVDDANSDWWELWTASPDKEGRRMNGRHLPSANDIAIPLNPARGRLHIRVQASAGAAPPTNILLGRRAC